MSRSFMQSNTIRLLAAFCGGASLIFAGAASHAAPPGAVGDPNKPGALAQALQDAYGGGARRIVITPGVYLLPNVGHPAITLDGWRDTVVSARGVTLISLDVKNPHFLFELKHCTNVTLEGALLSQAEVTSYQGRVIAVGKDADGKATADWRPDAGYPKPPDKEPKGFLGGDVNIVDAHTRLLKTANGDFYGAPAEALGDGTYRVHFSQSALNFGVGDFLVGRYGDAPFKVYLSDCRSCTIRDITMMRNGFAPIREERGGGNRYLHCVWALGPRPRGATENPVVTAAADGMHMTESYPGPDIEGCKFQGVFLDDCIAIHGYFTPVKSASGSTLTLEKDAGLKVGQLARISGDKGFFGEALVKAMTHNADNTWIVTLDRDLNVPASAKVSNPLLNGAGFKIVGCTLGNTRSRGILVKSDDGLIKNNIVSGCGQAAVSIGPEYFWNESDYARNVTIVGNTFRGNGIAAYGGGTILIHGDGAVGNRNIIIKNNTFIANYQGDLDISWTDGVTVSGNVFTGAAAWPAAMGRRSPVVLANSRHVTIVGNTVKNAAAYKPLLIDTGVNLSDLVGNDKSGVRAEAAAPSLGAYVHDGSLADTNLRYVGRWERSDGHAYRSYWGGAYLITRFTGTAIAWKCGQPGGPFLVSIDGETPRETSDTSIQSLKPGAHTLVLGSPGQNTELEFQGLTLDAGATTLPTPARPIVEFIGDSITTGGGRPVVPDTVNYAWRTAEALGCDHTQIAFSGVALTSGYGCIGKVGQDTQYFMLKNFNHLTDTPPSAWDFSYTPRIVVVNLGQNDQCGSEPPETMAASYASFLRKLRGKFPLAQIVSLRPFSGAFDSAIRSAVQTTIAAGDARLHFVDTSDWLAKEDFRDGIHPTDAGNRKVAAHLIPLLKPLLSAP